MTEIPILQDIVVIFGASLVVLFICHRLHIPAIVGFLLTGALIGPYGLGFVTSTHDVEVLAEIGIILLLFTIGMEFSFKELLRARRAVLLGGILQVGLTIVAIYGLIHVIGLTGNEALFAGFLVALSSTAIVLKSLQERAEINTPHGRTVLSILIFQDIIIVPMILITPMLSATGDASGESLSWLLVKGLITVVILLLAARYVVPGALYQITRTRSRELFLLAVAAIGMAVAWLTAQMGLSLGLGAFLAGLVISESEYSHQALEGVLPFRDVFNSFFFVSVGMLFDTGFMLDNFVMVIAIAVIVIVVKAIIAGGVGLALGLSLRSSLLAGLALAQVGEFSFILSRVGLSYDMIDSELYQLFIAVSVLSMAATPFIITLSPRLAERLMKLPIPERLIHGAMIGVDHINVHEPKANHLIIVGFGVNGRNLAHAAKQAAIDYHIIETNPDTVRSERAAGEPIEYGDATSEAVLEHAGIKNARILVIAISDPTATRRVTQLARDLNSHLHIIVRTRFVKEVKPLLDLGANEVIPEEFETSIEIFTRVLSRFLVPRDRIEQFISEIRSGEYEMLRSLSSAGPTVSDLSAHFPEAQVSAVRLSSDSPLVGQTLAQADLRGTCGVTILAIRRQDHTISNPGPTTDLQADDVLYLLGSSAALCDVDTLVRHA